jgi:hypothetical protein
MPTQTCTLCCRSLVLPEEPLVLVSHSQRVFHARCMRSVFPKAFYPCGVLSENLGARVTDVRAMTQLKRAIYIVAMSICVFAFGVLTHIAHVVVVTISVSVSAYLLVQAVDCYAYKQSTRIVQFGSF